MRVKKIYVENGQKLSIEELEKVLNAINPYEGLSSSSIPSAGMTFKMGRNWKIGSVEFIVVEDLKAISSDNYKLYSKTIYPSRSNSETNYEYKELTGHVNEYKVSANGTLPVGHFIRFGQKYTNNSASDCREVILSSKDETYSFKTSLPNLENSKFICKFENSNKTIEVKGSDLDKAAITFNSNANVRIFIEGDTEYGAALCKFNLIEQPAPKFTGLPSRSYINSSIKKEDFVEGIPLVQILNISSFQDNGFVKYYEITKNGESRFVSVDENYTVIPEGELTVRAIDSHGAASPKVKFDLGQFALMLNSNRKVGKVFSLSKK